MNHLRAAVFTLKHLKRSHQDGTSKKKQERGLKARVKAAKTEETAGAGNALEPINVFLDAMMCTTKMYRQRVFFKASYQSITTGSSHWKAAVTLKSITD